MRVIAGTLRGRRLAALKGHNVRPTPDRVREALFSILQSKLGTFAELRVLDLFAGSGALAIESLSRGAASACLVEKNPESAKVIQENLTLCNLSDKAKLLIRDSFSALQDFPANSFDLIFLDPPYGKNMAKQAIVAIDKHDLLSRSGLVCAETGRGEALPEHQGKLHQIDQRQYGSVMLNFYSISTEG